MRKLSVCTSVMLGAMAPAMSEVAPALPHWNLGFGDWSDADSWSPKEVPRIHDHTYIAQGVCEVTSSVSTFRIYVGEYLSGDAFPGSGQILVSASGTGAGKLSATDIVVGPLVDSFGRVEVRGYPAEMISKTLFVGQSGMGQIAVEDGGAVGVDYLDFGGFGQVSDGGGVVTRVLGDGQGEVKGAGSLLSALSIAVGDSGKGKLTVSNQGMVVASQLRVARNAGYTSAIPESRGEVVLTGQGTIMKVEPPSTSSLVQLLIGQGGNGKISILDGAKMLSKMGSQAYLASQPTSTGEVLVSGVGSEWLHTDRIAMGDSGTAHLVIADGGKIRAENGVSVSYGTSTVSRGSLQLLGGEAGQLSSPGILETTFVAGGTKQTAEFNGGVLRALSDQTNFISGFTSRTIETGGLGIDSNGHQVSVNSVLSGPGPLRKLGLGTLTLTTAHSYEGDTFIEQGDLLISKDFGLGTVGEVTVKDGGGIGKSVSTPVNVGLPVRLEGAASFVSPGGYFYLGPLTLPAGSHEVTLKPALSTGNAEFFIVASEPMIGSGNLVLKADSNDVPATFSLGGWKVVHPYSGEVTVGNGATFQIAGSGVSPEQGRFEGNLDIQSGGTVEVRSSERIRDDARVRVDGLLRFGSANTLTETIGRLEGGGSVRSFSASFGNWSQLLQVSEGAFSGNFSDGSSVYNPLKLRKVGPNILTLSGASSHSGGVDVNEGILRVTNVAGSATGSGPVEVQPSGRLEGDGEITGAVRVQGTLAPGAQTGVLTAHGDLTLASSSQTVIEIRGGTRGSGHDGIDVGGLLTYGGTLRIVVDSTFEFSPGTVLTVFQMSGGSAGQFSEIEWVGATGTFNHATGKVTLGTSAPVDPYRLWLEQNGLDLATTGAAYEDADDDGLSNALEFVLDSDPRSGASKHTLEASSDGTSFVFSFIRRKDSVSQFPTIIETSGNLGNTSWEPVAADNLEVEDLDEARERVTARVPIPPEEKQRFARVRLVEP